jgi:LmbE family N-acetylglucosaminyl deacetylase
MATLLAVTAHPDDESFLFGGALAAYAAAGHRCGLLCLTDGQQGRTGGLVDRRDLGELRRAELGRAAGVLGIEHLFTPGLVDGELDRMDDAAGADLVATCADRFGADVLLTFGPEGASGHADHKACWRWTTASANNRRVYAATFPEGLQAEVRGGKPLPVTTVIDIGRHQDSKRRAFLEHASQRDHLELFDRILTGFDGQEYYHRVRPALSGDSAPETSLIG